MADGQDQNATPSLWRNIRDFFKGRNGASLRESLEEAIEEHEETGASADLDEGERRMLLNILDYGEIRVDDIMIPRADIVAVDITTDLDALLGVVSVSAHSRMPVFRDTLDNVTGMVHVKDLVKAIADGISPEAFSLPAIQRPVLYVPASMRIRDLLSKMRARRTHMAVVVDEYGGTDGLVTIEDLVEQIVGEIEDEHDDDDEPTLTPANSGQYDADARVEIEALEALIGVDLKDDEEVEDVDTLGGLVFALAGRVPDIGEIIAHSCGYKFEVVDADPRKIRKIRVHPPGAVIAAANQNDESKPSVKTETPEETPNTTASTPSQNTNAQARS